MEIQQRDPGGSCSKQVQLQGTGIRTDIITWVLYRHQLLYYCSVAVTAVPGTLCPGMCASLAAVLVLDQPAGVQLELYLVLSVAIRQWHVNPVHIPLDPNSPHQSPLQVLAWPQEDHCALHHRRLHGGFDRELLVAVDRELHGMLDVDPGDVRQRLACTVTKSHHEPVHCLIRSDKSDA